MIETKSKVTPYHYQVHQIIYNDGNFLIAWGEGKDQTMRIAMRWKNENLGTPETFGSPVWFPIPESLSILMLRSLVGLDFSHSEEIKKVIANGEKWDRQIQTDAESGKLDFLIEEALSEKKLGILRKI